MFIVRSLSPGNIEEFARNWCDAVMQAQELAQTLNAKVTIRQIGTDTECFMICPIQSSPLDD